MSRTSTKVVAAAVLLVALVLAGVVSHYADSDPDGLTKVSEDQGFASTEKTHATGDGPLAGYDASFIDDGRLSGGVAGVLGVLVVLGLAGGLTYAVRRRDPADEKS
jgi:cobalt/nickel transport system permease protein/cobalt/nickel transport protein